MQRSRLLNVLWLFTCTAVLVAAPPETTLDPESLLPPAMAWDGASRSWIAATDDPWRTPAEASEFRTTPDYDTTVAWVERLVEASPRLHKVSLGDSLEGRPIWMVVASADGADSPEALHASGRPLLLAHAGIHSGEIDGKDAGLMLLRDLTVGGRQGELLEAASLLFVPILNVDGHERRSAYNRMNQRGPDEMGWRTNAANLNLNRDYAKLDTPEIRALVQSARSLATRPLSRPPRHRWNGQAARCDMGIPRSPLLVSSRRCLAGEAARCRPGAGARGCWPHPGTAHLLAGPPGSDPGNPEVDRWCPLLGRLWCRPPSAYGAGREPLPQTLRAEGSGNLCPAGHQPAHTWRVWRGASRRCPGRSGASAFRDRPRMGQE